MCSVWVRILCFRFINKFLRILNAFFENILLFGGLINGINTIRFIKNSHYEDIVKGPPLGNRTHDTIFCGHALKYLSFYDFRITRRNSIDNLKTSRVFWPGMPNLRAYETKCVQSCDPKATNMFISDAFLGVANKLRGVLRLTKFMLGNCIPLRMFFYTSIASVFLSAGFIETRRCNFNDAENPEFLKVDDVLRFVGAFAIEAKKPF